MTRFQINPGEFKHSITFQKLDKTYNGYGEPLEAWSDIKTVKAGIYPISGDTFFAAEKENSKITHKINLRFIRGLTPDMRVKFQDRYFSIESIINFQERNVMLQLMCKELM